MQQSPEVRPRIHRGAMEVLEIDVAALTRMRVKRIDEQVAVEGSELLRDRSDATEFDKKTLATIDPGSRIPVEKTAHDKAHREITRRSIRLTKLIFERAMHTATLDRSKTSKG
jgi:hypothetical protein